MFEALGAESRFLSHNPCSAHHSQLGDGRHGEASRFFKNVLQESQEKNWIRKLGRLPHNRNTSM